MGETEWDGDGDSVRLPKSLDNIAETTAGGAAVKVSRSKTDWYELCDSTNEDEEETTANTWNKTYISIIFRRASVGGGLKNVLGFQVTK